MRRLALLIPINRKGQVLLQHRTADAPRKPDYWAFFGGHIELGEHPTAAAIREFAEELQIEIDGGMKFFGRYTFQEEDGQVEKFFFMILLDENPDFLKDMQLEGDDLGYFGYKDLGGLKISADDKKVLDDFWA